MGKDPRGRTTVELGKLAPIVEEFKSSIEWSELTLSQKIKVLLRERLLLGPDFRGFLEDLLVKIEANEPDAAIAQIKQILEDADLGG